MNAPSHRFRSAAALSGVVLAGAIGGCAGLPLPGAERPAAGVPDAAPADPLLAFVAGAAPGSVGVVRDGHGAGELTVVAGAVYHAASGSVCRRYQTRRGADSQPSGHLPAETPVTVLAVRGSWYRVDLGAKGQALVSRPFLEPVSSPGPAARDGGQDTADHVVTGDLWYRSGPGKAFPAKGWWPKGTLVRVASAQGDWYVVSLPGGDSAYASAHYLRPVRAGPAPGPPGPGTRRAARSSRDYVTVSETPYYLSPPRAGDPAGESGLACRAPSGPWQRVELLVNPDLGPREPFARRKVTPRS